jgi:hypothetical protein
VSSLTPLLVQNVFPAVHLHWIYCTKEKGSKEKESRVQVCLPSVLETMPQALAPDGERAPGRLWFECRDRNCHDRLIIHGHVHNRKLRLDKIYQKKINGGQVPVVSGQDAVRLAVNLQLRLVGQAPIEWFQSGKMIWSPDYREKFAVLEEVVEQILRQPITVINIETGAVILQ